MSVLCANLGDTEQPPRVDFSVASAGDSLTAVFCPKNSGGPAYSWQWDFGDSSRSSLALPKHTFKSTGVFAVSLIAAGPGGIDSAYRAVGVSRHFIGSGTARNNCIVVFSPNGGETFHAGDTVTVRFGVVPGAASVDQAIISLYTENNKIKLVGNLTGGIRLEFDSAVVEYPWIVPDSIALAPEPGSLWPTYRALRDSTLSIKVSPYTGTGMEDFSDSVFSVK